MDDELSPGTAKNLQEAVGFTDEDLAANRSGMMSSRQVEEWRARGERAKKGGLPTFGIIFGAILLLGTAATFGFMIWQAMQSGGSAAMFTVLILLGVFLLIVGISVVQWIRFRPLDTYRQIQTGTYPVKRFTGEVKLVQTSPADMYGGSAIYDLKVGRMRVMTDAATSFFEKGRKYHLYGLVLGPNVLTLLSAEPAE